MARKTAQPTRNLAWIPVAVAGGVVLGFASVLRIASLATGIALGVTLGAAGAVVWDDLRGQKKPPRSTTRSVAA